MTTPDVGTDDKVGVTIRCQDNASVGVTFCDRFSFDADSVHYAVELRAPGLTARVSEVVAWVWDSDLTAFLEELAADYRGWDGERSWQTNDRDLTVSAVFRSGGHVGLTWALRPWTQDAGRWDASVTTWLEAGEQMTSLAADVQAFLAEAHRRLPACASLGRLLDPGGPTAPLKSTRRRPSSPRPTSPVRPRGS